MNKTNGDQDAVGSKPTPTDGEPREVGSKPTPKEPYSKGIGSKPSLENTHSSSGANKDRTGKGSKPWDVAAQRANGWSMEEKMMRKTARSRRSTKG